jgi:hypothetical protein
MNLIDNALKHFSPVSLGEMDCIQLMNRTDAKFVFPSNLLHELLLNASNHYRILEINKQRDFFYSTTYLDTINYLFFNEHMRSKPQRYKVRYRTYEATGQSFLEVKCKTNKNRTVKWRIKNKLNEFHPDDQALEFLSGYINDVANEIGPKLTNRFHRITLAGLETKERITIDYDISFSGDDGSSVILPYLAIAEVKREGYTNGSPILDILKRMHIRQSGFSKYCIGCSLVRPMPKINMLKSKLLLLQKIENEYALTIAG